MKFSKVEWAGLCVTAGVLVFLCGWSLRDRLGGESYRVTGQRLPQTAETTVQSFVPDAPVDLNTATLAQLMALPGLGRVRAQAILDYRAENGPFTYPEDVIQVPGIGQSVYEGLAGRITALSP